MASSNFVSNTPAFLELHPRIPRSTARTTPSNPSGQGSAVLSGEALRLASIPLDPRTRASNTDRTVGIETGPYAGFAADAEPAPEATPFAGMGPLLEDDDKEVFSETDAMVRRQQLLADNRWNQDEYYRCVVDGYPWATLEHDTTRDVFTFSLPWGVSSLSIQPIPNKNLELVNETSEQILQDFPEITCDPIDDSEEAKNASTAGDRFLVQDDGEEGTNEEAVYDEQVKTALFTGTTYNEYWIDPTGGGYVPLQILAHPQAVSPDEPLKGPDGNPTTDYILRYVTAPQGGQFTDDPTQAAPQWQPKVMVSLWGREHVRCYPENRPANKAEQIILLGHCTIGEAKKRWPAVAQMAPEDLSALLDWTPVNYLRLLPPYQRARWMLSDGKTQNKAGASDERILFYYHRWCRANPDHKKGADVVMSGIDGGMILDRKLLAVDVEVEVGQAEMKKETRCRQIPIVNITPRRDPTGKDPTGKCYLSLVVGATEYNGFLSQGFADNLQKVLKSPYMVGAFGPDKAQIDAARASGETIVLQMPMQDQPFLMQPPKLPQEFFQMSEYSDEQINRAAFRTRAASGQENAKERSGKALQIAVSQNAIGNSSMITNVNNPRARGARIKLELMMAECTTTQQVAYVGEDGANKLEDLHAMDFALVGKVSVKAGTGTGLTQDNKIQYMANLKAEGGLSEEEFAEAARPNFSKRLGLPDNPHIQRVSRAIDAWLDGPPKPDEHAPPDPMTGQPMTWQQQARAWQQFDQAQAQYTQAAQQAQQVAAVPPVMVPGQAAPSPPVPPPLPPAPVPPQFPRPWSPFNPRPNDTEPALSAIWMRKMSLVMSGVDYEKYSTTEPEWTVPFDVQYNRVRQSAAIAGTTPGVPQTARPPTQPNAQQPTPPTQPQQPQQPQQSPPTLSAGA